MNLLLKLPWDLKYNKGVTKFLLKRISKKYLPNQIINRKKKGFEVPIGVVKGPLKEWSLERIEEKSLYSDLPFDIKHVRNIYDLHLNSNRNVTPFLWNILVLLNFVSLRKAY